MSEKSGYGTNMLTFIESPAIHEIMSEAGIRKASGSKTERPFAPSAPLGGSEGKVGVRP
jgi:hypothetical protein